MPTKKPLLSFNMEQRDFDRLEDYRFEHRFQSRAAAANFLLRWALTRNPSPTDEEGQEASVRRDAPNPTT